MEIQKYYNRKFYSSKDKRYLSMAETAERVLADSAKVIDKIGNKDITNQVLLKYVRQAKDLTELELRLLEVKEYLNR
jgi:polyhydroxyalkanoate synthesis regulator protein